MEIKNKIKRIAIIGLGLIGGSLALALKVNGYYIVGITKNPDTLAKAKKEKAIDIGYTELNNEELNNVDLIFLTPPLSYIPEYINQISKIVKKEIILTDAGSTKVEICNFAKKVLPENITFIGGHPMAGTEKAGFAFAQIGLFKQCAWILTPVNNTENTKQAIKILEDIVIQIGAKPIQANPKKHDQAVALISHLPLIASIGLCQIVRNLKDSEVKHLATVIASSGFKDTTRIGGGNPEMNSNLLTSNFLQISTLLQEYSTELERLIKLAKEHPETLLKTLSEVTEWRSKLYSQEGKNNLLNKVIERV